LGTLAGTLASSSRTLSDSCTRLEFATMAVDKSLSFLFPGTSISAPTSASEFTVLKEPLLKRGITYYHLMRKVLSCSVREASLSSKRAVSSRKRSPSPARFRLASMMRRVWCHFLRKSHIYQITMISSFKVFGEVAYFSIASLIRKSVDLKRLLTYPSASLPLLREGRQ